MPIMYSVLFLYWAHRETALWCISLCDVFLFQLNSPTVMLSTLLFIGYGPDVPVSVLVQHFDCIPQRALVSKENVNRISTYFKLLWEILNYCAEKNIFLTHQKLDHTLSMWRVCFRMLVNISSMQSPSQEPKHKYIPLDRAV